MKKNSILVFNVIVLVLLLASCGKTYEVSFDLDEGVTESEVKTLKVKSGSKIKEPIEPTKENMTFIGWYLDDEKWDFNNEVLQSMTLKAHYKINEYTVTFNNAGGMPEFADQTVAYGNKAVRPDNPTLEGNTFLGWFNEDVEFDFDEVITNNLTLNAKWEKEVYSVSFLYEEEGKELSNDLITYGSKITEPNSPTKEHASFLGWYYEGRKWNFDNVVTSDMTIVGRWNIYYDLHLNDLKEYYQDTLDIHNYRPLEDLLLLDEINGMKITWESSNEDYLTNKGEIILPPRGEKAVKVYLKAYLTPAYYLTFTLEILNYDPLEAPEFSFTEEYQEVIQVNWNKTYNPLKGVKVIDNYDGDITNNIEVLNVIDTTNYGIFTVTLKIENSFGNVNTLERLVEVVWDYEVTFIGHAGSYYGLMNSEEAIMYGITVLKYQAIEVDLKQTKDGVFVLSHDDTFGGYNIAQTNWSVLKDVKVTSARKTGYPAQNGSVTNSPYTASLLTLEDFLEICKTHNVKAVIELKHSPGINNGDQSQMQPFLDLVEEKGMLDDIILLTSQLNVLIWTRNNGYEYIPCQYLVGSIESESILESCITHNLDVSTNIGNANSLEWILRYKANNIKVAVYTFSQWQDYKDLQNWIDKGVDYVTVDWHIMSKLDLKEKDNIERETFTVTFKDYDGTIISTVSVTEGSSALAPVNLTRVGYTFTGWSESILAIVKDLTVTATYEINTYTINYDPNVYLTELETYANKAEFVAEFYNDFYLWLLEYGKDLSFITVNDNKVTININGVNKTINNVSELKAVDIYEFEKSFGTLIYKPFNRVNNEPFIMEESNLYFLNTLPYKLKYAPLDEWFLNAMINNYTSYDKGYKQASNGRVQIMFRFHQWQQGTSIKEFNIMPQKQVITGDANFNYEMPTTNLTYTVADEFTLPVATGDKEFLGWYLDKDYQTLITEIEKGSYGNITLYAKWAE